jgi:hypothetical protein
MLGSGRRKVRPENLLGSHGEEDALVEIFVYLAMIEQVQAQRSAGAVPCQTGLKLSWNIAVGASRLLLGSSLRALREKGDRTQATIGQTELYQPWCEWDSCRHDLTANLEGNLTSTS